MRGGERPAAPTLQVAGPQQPLTALLFISCCHHFAQSNSPQSVFNISETDEPSIAQRCVIFVIPNTSSERMLQDDSDLTSHRAAGEELP